MAKEYGLPSMAVGSKASDLIERLLQKHVYNLTEKRRETLQPGQALERSVK